MQALKTFKTVLKTIIIVSGIYFVLYYLDYREIGRDIKRVKKAKRCWL